jgi:Zn-finger nucleic acid-binding protein
MKGVCFNCEVVFISALKARLSKVICPQCRGKLIDYHTKTADDAEAWLFKHKIANFRE